MKLSLRFWLLVGTSAAQAVLCPKAGASEQPPPIIQTSSSASGSSIITHLPSGGSSGGYSGFDGVSDCAWYDTDEPGINPEKVRVLWNIEPVLMEWHLYWFQCVSVETGIIEEARWRAWPPKPEPTPPPGSTILSTWAFYDWDQLPLPDPALRTSPPAAMHVVNLESWFWASLPANRQVRSDAGPGNWSLVTATVKNLTLNLDEPGVEPVVCPNGGVPWTTSSPKHDPDACTYTFTKRGPHHITATLTWAVTATGAVDGRPINATAPDRTTSTTLDITVNEILTHIKAEE